MKKILEAIRELVEVANFDCSANGLQVQAMDTSHVTLVALSLFAAGFQDYRCDRQMLLGIKIASMSRILKCANNEDQMLLRAEDGADEISFMFESAKRERMSVFDMKLMEIESDPLAIPEQKYSCVVSLPAVEFQRICRDLQTFGDYVDISVTKGDVTFSVYGESGNGQVRLSSTQSVDAKPDESTTIFCETPLSLSFALRFLCLFTKATPLSSTVTLSMVSNEVPLVVEYPISNDKGSIRYYLAPKFDDDAQAGGASSN